MKTPGQEEAFALMDQRDAIEKEIETLNYIIMPLAQAGYNKPNTDYIDEEGFPDANIDWGKLTQYRESKKRFNGIILT
jgi:hypothetical protein